MSMNYPTLALDFWSLFPLGPSGLADYIEEVGDHLAEAQSSALMVHAA